MLRWINNAAENGALNMSGGKLCRAIYRCIGYVNRGQVPIDPSEYPTEEDCTNCVEDFVCTLYASGARQWAKRQRILNQVLYNPFTVSELPPCPSGYVLIENAPWSQTLWRRVCAKGFVSDAVGAAYPSCPYGHDRLGNLCLELGDCSAGYSVYGEPHQPIPGGYTYEGGRFCVNDPSCPEGYQHICEDQVAVGWGGLIPACRCEKKVQVSSCLNCGVNALDPGVAVSSDCAIEVVDGPCGSWVPECTACTPAQTPDALCCTPGGVLISGVTNKRRCTASGGTWYPRQTLNNLYTLQFSPCFGSGAAGSAVAEGGSIVSVSLLSAGSGYAVLGRKTPALSVPGADGAVIVYTMFMQTCGRPAWSISSVVLPNGGEFTNEQDLPLSLSADDTQVNEASCSISVARFEPTITATATAGSGASFSVSLSGGPSSWSVASVSVTGTTSGYVDGSELVLSGGVEASPAHAVIRSIRVAPTVSLSVYSYSSGAGAVLTPTLSTGTSWEGRPIWYVSGIAIGNGGAGYSQYDQVTVSLASGDQSDEYSWFEAYVESVDEDGAITGITINSGGGFFRPTGVIQSIDVTDSGSYYDAVNTVNVEYGGVYYGEDASLPPIASSVTVAVSPSGGTPPSSPAVVAATIGLNPALTSFGRIIGLTITAPGSGYVGGSYLPCSGNPFP